jgi:hypothetical protein
MKIENWIYRVVVVVVVVVVVKLYRITQRERMKIE